MIQPKGERYKSLNIIRDFNFSTLLSTTDKTSEDTEGPDTINECLVSSSRTLHPVTSKATALSPHPEHPFHETEHILGQNKASIRCDRNRTGPW